MPASIPIRILMFFTLALMGVAVFTVFDAQRRDELEVVVNVSGLGDEDLFVPSQAIIDGEVPISTSTLQFGGITLHQDQYNPSSKQDRRMLRQGRDATDTWWIYQEEPPGSSNREVDPALHYVRVGKGLYLRFTSTPPEEAGIGT